jgi:Ca2+-binding EF-hand superfamily protein
LSIFISTQEKQALMERLDIDRDGKITENEMLKVLTDASASTDSAVQSTIRKIAAGASKYGSMSEYVKDLVRKFDRNSDGFLSIGELTDGLKKIGIFLNSQEI